MLLQKVTNWGHEKKYTQDRSHDWLRRSHGHRSQLPAPERININMNIAFQKNEGKLKSTTILFGHFDNIIRITCRKYNALLKKLSKIITPEKILLTD